MTLRRTKQQFSALMMCLLITLGLANASLAAPPGSPWGENYFPNIPLVTHEGKQVRFYQDLIKDKVVALNFIFTHCSDSCPMETANMRKIQHELGERVGKEVFLYSISINPQQDTPEVLKAYAEKFGAQSGWTFLTGNAEDIKLLRKKLGLYNADEEQGNNLQGHSISMMVGNEATGQWMKRSAFDEPKVLARVLGTFLQTGHKSASQVSTLAGASSYSKAQQLPHLSKGEQLFRSRCDSCHSLGTEDGIGPGLAGVTLKRDKAWLAQWIKAPDKLLKEQDPLAVALYQQYNQMIMPNFRLSDADVDALLEFMATSNNPDLGS